MESQVIYCSACDREVEVLLPRGAGAEEGLAGARCLAREEICTGTMCPILALPPTEDARGGRTGRRRRW